MIKKVQWLSPFLPTNEIQNLHNLDLKVVLQRKNFVFAFLKNSSKNVSEKYGFMGTLGDPLWLVCDKQFFPISVNTTFFRVLNMPKFGKNRRNFFFKCSPKLLTTCKSDIKLIFWSGLIRSFIIYTVLHISNGYFVSLKFFMGGNRRPPPEQKIRNFSTNVPDMRV